VTVCYIPPGKLPACPDDLQMHNSMQWRDRTRAGRNLYKPHRGADFMVPMQSVSMTIVSLAFKSKAMVRRGQKLSKPRAELVMPGSFDAAEMPRLDAFDEEFGQNSVAIQRGQRRTTRVRFWTVLSVALGVGATWLGLPLTGCCAGSCNPQTCRYRRQPAKVWMRKLIGSLVRWRR
jgi:hypothetical protein